MGLETYELVTRESGTDKTGKAFDRLKVKIQEVDRAAGKVTEGTAKLNRKTGAYTEAITKKTIPKVKEFKFEYLGLMFAGMALQKSMQGLLQPALQTAGVFELWNDIMELMFLPTALKLIDPLLGILEGVDGTDDGLKDLLGTMALFGMGAGSLLAFFGQLVLGASSLAMALPDIIKITKAMAVFVGGKLSAVVTVGGKVAKTLWGLFSGTGGWLLGKVSTAVSFIVGKVNSLITWIQTVSGVSSASALGKAIYIGVNIVAAWILLEAATKALSWIFIAMGNRFGGEKTEIGSVLLKLGAEMDGGYLQFILKAFFDKEYAPGRKITAGVLEIGINPVMAGLPWVSKILKQALDKKPLEVSLNLIGNMIMTNPAVKPTIDIVKIISQLFGVHLAAGGIVTSPTPAIVGDAGPEAIIPLNSLNNSIGGNYYNEINVYPGNINSSVDVRDMAELIDEELVDRQKRREIL